MTETRARELLFDFIKPDNSLDSISFYILWEPSSPNDLVIDNDPGTLTPELLEAIAWWIRRHSDD